VSAHRGEAAPGVAALKLESDELSVTVLPDKGCDIYAFVDRVSGIDLLFKTPWGLRRPGPGAHAHDSATHWLEHYPGGWQVLLPNGGAASGEHGTEWGFHGEASLVPWRVEGVGESDAVFSTRLFRAPLLVERRVVVDGALLRIEEAVTNESPDAIEVMWGHHPAFGAPFLEAGCSLATGARAFTADDVSPGTVFTGGSRHRWPDATAEDGASVDLEAIPGPDQRLSHLGYLTDFSDGFFAISNPRLQLGIGLTWSLDVFPHAWFWQEVHASPGFPWYRRAYVCAVEPSTTIPAQGLTTARQKGGSGLILQGGERRRVELEAMLFRGRGRVSSIDPGGRVHFADG
jgi:hypothetical protein